MTAFAAVLALDGAPPGDGSSGRVARALSHVAGSDPGRRVEGACELLLSPLPARDALGPLKSEAGTAITGQVLLENPRGLAAQLSAPGDAPDLLLALLAYDRWEHGFASRLHGEYALTIWDPRSRTLVCARDGLGLRLLYIAHAATTVVATNALSAALAHPAVSDDVDELAAIEFLACGGLRDQVRTAFRAVRLVPPGHTLSIPLGRTPALFRHWSFPSPEPAVSMNRQEVIDTYRAVLRDAVADRTRGRRASIFLSGGVDSTTIAAAARESDSSDRLRAITCVYTRFCKVDELRYARLAADALGIPLTVVPADLQEALSAQRFGTITPEPIDEPTLSDWRDAAAAAAAHAPTALYGEDGDAVFLPPAGTVLWRAEGVRLVPRLARYAISVRRVPYVGIRLRERLANARRISAGTAAPPWVSSMAARALADSTPAALLGLRPEPLPPHPYRPEAQERLTGTIARVLAPLVASEVTGQRLEFRFPLLDTRLLTFVMSVPPIPWCQHKALPREAYRGRLPAEILTRPKTAAHGFYEALVASWKSTRVAPDLPACVHDWVNQDAWFDALRSEDPLEVMRAWRALQLGAWMVNRPRQLACTR